MAIREKFYPALSQGIALGIDAGYSFTGLALLKDNRDLLALKTLRFPGKWSKKEKRMELVREIRALPFLPDLIVFEYTREFSTNKKTGEGFHSALLIECQKQLRQAVVDAFPVPVVSVDTRSAKARIVGKANADKETTVFWVEQLTGERGITDHAADAYCFGRCAYDATCHLWIAE